MNAAVCVCLYIVIMRRIGARALRRWSNRSAPRLSIEKLLYTWELAPDTVKNSASIGFRLGNIVETY